jgi:succinate-semialdehyde dehydrogenase/glutarate-semialdehyde dehydrogenase
MDEYPKLRLYIDGQWLEQTSSGSIGVENPADGSNLGQLPVAGNVEIDAALAAAGRGYRVWRSRTAFERFQVITQATRLLRERAPRIARAITLEQGKPLNEALREVQLSADIIDFLAEEGKRLYGRTVPPRQANVLSQTVMRQPVGPVAAFTPWNFPVNLPSRKLGGALAAGCSVIIKPAEETPASCMLIVEAFHDAGMPPGVINMVCGEPSKISTALLTSEPIRKASFTGSIAVGKALGELAARGMKRYTAELGGHAPVIVCADADIEKTAKLAVAAKFRNAGQVCASPIRFYIHESRYAEFRDRFVAHAGAIKVGSGLDQSSDMGPLIHARRVREMQNFVDDALARGGKLCCGGQALPGKGHFYPPTVLEQVPVAARVQQIEPFGPIALLQPFSTIDEALAEANGLAVGLSAYAFTRDLTTAHRLGEELEAGMVGINHFGVSQPETPFGGWKESGMGQESGMEGLLAYTEVKLVSIAA